MGPYSSEPEVLLTHVMTLVGVFKDETQSFTISTYYENPIYFQNSITFNYWDTANVDVRRLSLKQFNTSNRSNFSGSFNWYNKC